MNLFFRFDSNYHLTLKYKCGKTGQEKEVASDMPIEKYFDESGKLLYDRVADHVLLLHSDIDHKKEDIFFQSFYIVGNIIFFQ